MVLGTSKTIGSPQFGSEKGVFMSQNKSDFIMAETDQAYLMIIWKNKAQPWCQGPHGLLGNSPGKTSLSFSGVITAVSRKMAAVVSGWIHTPVLIFGGAHWQ
jgi:hypothetical protein